MLSYIPHDWCILTNADLIAFWPQNTIACQLPNHPIQARAHNNASKASSYKWESLAYQQTITMYMDCYFAIFLLYLDLIMTRPIKFASMLAEQASPTRSSSSSSKTEHGQLGANTKHTHAALPPQQRASWRVLEDLGLTP